MEEIQRALQEAIEKLFDIKVDVNVTEAPENTGADYASNIAMQLAKLVHRASLVIAEMIKGEFEGGAYKVEVAAPGFLNFTLDDEAVLKQVRGYAEDLDKEVADESYKDKKVVAEFSDPNPFKVLHVGHLYTSIVGDSISRLMEFAGAEVIRANFGGDVGLHVSKTLYALLNKMADATHLPILGHDVASARRYGGRASSSSLVSSGDSQNRQMSSSNSVDKFISKLTIEDIAKCYVEGTRAYDEDEVAKAEITRLNKEIYRINAEDLHDSELARLYWRGRELSYEYFDKFYAQIGVKFDKYYPESTVADKGVQEVKAHTGTTYEESDGAIVYKGEKVGLHTRVFINREGVPTYETKDVGLIFTKWDDWHFDESVVVTGNEQSDYMKVVLASVSEYAPQLVDRTTHLTHGLVKLPGNVKMSSRKGNFLKAVEVLEMIEELLRWDGEEVDRRILLAAIKYAFLRYKMGGDIVFDPQESVSVTGNSGIYLLYSTVRAKKILQKKSEKKFESAPEEVTQERVFEKKLSKKIIQYKDILAEAVREKAPHKICNYLYELSQEFSRFYEHVKVSGNRREGELMGVVRAYQNVMVHGLGLLGIEVPDEM